LVLFRAWLQRSGSSLGEVVGRVEVEVERRRGRCRRSGRVMARTALTGQPRQTMCGLGAGPRGFFFQQKSAQYSASGIGWTQTTFHTLSPDAPAEPNQPASPREGKEGRCADICPIRKPPPKHSTRLGRVPFASGCSVPSYPRARHYHHHYWPCRGPARGPPKPANRVCSGCSPARLSPCACGNTCQCRATLARSQQRPLPRMHRKSANGRGPVPLNWTPAVRFRGPLLSPARFSPLGASPPHVSMGPETRLVSQVHK
jgi:hypothetical protein